MNQQYYAHQDAQLQAALAAGQAQQGQGMQAWLPNGCTVRLTPPKDPYEATQKRFEAVVDENSRLRHEQRELLAENARLRRELERLRR